MDLFLKQKSDTFEAFTKLINVLQNPKGYTILSLRSDHGDEFEKYDFVEFCKKNGINHNFSTLGPFNKMELLRGKVDVLKR